MDSKRQSGDKLSASPVRSVTRALTLLSQLTVEGVSLTEAAQRADVPLPTALRLMRTLEREGFAQRRDDGTFVVGPSAVMLAYRTDPTGPLRWTIRRTVQTIRDATNESVGFFMRAESNVVCVEAAESTQTIRWVARRGASIPLYSSVPGRMLLAYSNTDDLLDLIPTTDGKYVERNGSLRPLDDLRAELEHIRQTGVSTADFTPGSDAWGFALKYPVEGPCIGTFMLAGPRARTTDRRELLIGQVRDIITAAAASMPFGAPDAFQFSSQTQSHHDVP